MKKFIFLSLTVALFLSCSELKRNNPYDPASENYIKITYKGEVWYPSNTEIFSMIINKEILILATLKSDGPGYCIVKLLDNSNAHLIGTTGSTLGTFTSISDLCADGLDNIYIVDSKPFVQVMDINENFTWFPITYTAGIGTLSIEFFNNNLFITNDYEKRILKYSTGGVFVDSKNLSVTANGDFIPGRIFKSSTNIFIINKNKKNEILKLDEGLNIIDDIIFKNEILDAIDVDDKMQLLSENSVFKVDNNLNILLKWGDFGEGPGRVLNGKLITYNPVNKYIYILDGQSLKMFGE